MIRTIVPCAAICWSPDVSAEALFGTTTMPSGFWTSACLMKLRYGPASGSS
jgi:hypothetical protein